MVQKVACECSPYFYVFKACLRGMIFECLFLFERRYHWIELYLFVFRIWMINTVYKLHLLGRTWHRSKTFQYKLRHHSPTVGVGDHHSVQWPYTPMDERQRDNPAAVACQVGLGLLGFCSARRLEVLSSWLSRQWGTSCMRIRPLSYGRHRLLYMY